MKLTDIIWPENSGLALRIPSSIRRRGGGHIPTPRPVRARATAFANGHPRVPVSFQSAVGSASGIGLFTFEGGGNLIVDDEGIHFVIARPYGRVTGALTEADILGFSVEFSEVMGLGWSTRGTRWLGTETNRAAILLESKDLVEFDFVAGWLSTGRGTRDEFVEAVASSTKLEPRKY